MKTVILAIFSLIILGSLACKKKLERAYIEGRVINAGSGKPIDSVSITVKDGVGNNYTTTSSGRKVETFTNSNGQFSLSIEGEFNPYIAYGKAGYPQSKPYEPLHWGDNKNLLLELQAPADFCGVFKCLKGDSDSLIVDFLTYEKYKHLSGNESLCTGSGNNDCGCHMCFAGTGPFEFCQGNRLYQLTGDMYLRFNLKIKRNGIWENKKDSVYIKSFETYKDTIYY